MTTDNFCQRYSDTSPFSIPWQNRLIRTSQTGGQWYSDTSPFSIPWPDLSGELSCPNNNNKKNMDEIAKVKNVKSEKMLTECLVSIS